MSKFFFTNQDVRKDYQIELPKYESQIPLDLNNSRTFQQGKSFRFWEWKGNESRTFVNDSFFQDLVKYEGSIWICINTTTSIPGTSEDWVIFASKGDKGEPGPKGETGVGWDWTILSNK